MARVTVQGKTASNSLVDLLVNEDGSLSAGGATASEIGAAVNTLPALTDRSGTVATGGAAQEVMPANAARRSGSLVNLDSLSGWASETGTAAPFSPGSILVGAHSVFIVEGIGAVSWFHATTGAKFTSSEG